MEMRNVTGKHSGLLSLLRYSVFTDQETTPASRIVALGLHSSIFACNCRTQRDHGFDRCNRHITLRDHQRGHQYCIQCRTHCDVTEATSFEAAMQMRRNWRRMRPDTPLTPEEADFYSRRIFRDGIRDAPQDCHCDCAGCLGPEPPPLDPVVNVEPPSKRVRRS